MRTRKILLRRVGIAAAAVTVAASGIAVTSPATSAAVRDAVAPVTEAWTDVIPAPPSPDRLRPLQQVLTVKGARPTKATAAPAAPKATAAPAAPKAMSRKGAPGSGTDKTLVLYDTTGPYAWLGEIYAIQSANLASHFGSWTAAPVAGYKTGDMAGYRAVIYVGSTYDEPLPLSFLDDVTAGTKPVTWIYDNIWQLAARDPKFAENRGFTYKQFDLAKVANVNYKGKSLTRDARNAAGIMDVTVSDPAKTTVLAEAVREDGSTFPWAVRSGNLTYIGEIPFAYMTHDDRYLAFADLLFDPLAPEAKERRRALVRIEDVGPDADPADLRAIADYLYSQKVPFSVATYPRYRDPKGVTNGGKPADYTLHQRPEVVKAIKYMQSRGGSLLMHGYTHQNGNTANPYDGVSGNDFEFYQAHVDANDSVIYDGPVAGDSPTYATGRVLQAKLAFAQAGLTQPTIFEFPHYAGSAANYKSIDTLFDRRYDRPLFFPGVLTGGKPDYTRPVGQFFPYSVRDVYGSAVVPENIGNVEPEAFNNHPARLPVDLIASADRNLVIRDSVASFFYHPYLGTDYLKELVPGIKGKGYTFVTPDSMIAG